MIYSWKDYASTAPDIVGEEGDIKYLTLPCTSVLLSKVNVKFKVIARPS